MDNARLYFQKVRQVEAGIPTRDAVVVSLETPDGGKAGVKTEVPRVTAARLVVENRARLASEEETAAYQAEVADARRAWEQSTAASRMHLTVIPEADLRAIRSKLQK